MNLLRAFFIVNHLHLYLIVSPRFFQPSDVPEYASVSDGDAAQDRGDEAPCCRGEEAVDDVLGGIWRLLP